MRTFLIAAAVLLVAVAAPLSIAQARVESERYVSMDDGAEATANLGWLGLDALPDRFSSVCDANVNGACFALQPGDAAATIRMADDSGARVAGRYAFRDADRNALASGDFCESVEAAVPAGATLLVVVTADRPSAPCEARLSSVVEGATGTDPPWYFDVTYENGFARTTGTITTSFT